MLPLIEVRQLSVASQKQILLDRVDLRVEKNDFISIVGPNGAGKSTLLQCILGLRSFSAGQIDRPDQLTLGYAPQNLSFDPVFPLTVHRLLAMRQPSCDQYRALIFESLSLTPLLQKRIGQLSGGERQRVLLARALLPQPQLVILDEPEQNLDLDWQDRLHQLLIVLHRDHDLTVIVVSHHLRLVIACSSKVVCLFHHVCCQGTPQQVSNDDSFLKLFGRYLAPYQHQQENCLHRHGDN